MSINNTNNNYSSSTGGSHHHHHHPHQHQQQHHYLGVGKDLKKKFTKTFDLSQIAEDPMDAYLDTLGLWKKRIARDGSCLFRAVAEQIYPCQNYHEKCRQECLRYIADHKDEYSKFVSSITIDEYLEAMKNPLENGGQIEIAAMSKLYQRDFIIFQHQDQPGVDVTQNGYEQKIYLCFSYNNHFDAIFTKAHRDRLALIQSLVYEILYDRVFDSGEQVSLARKLLRKSDTIYPKEYMRLGDSENDYDDEDDDDVYHDESVHDHEADSAVRLDSHSDYETSDEPTTCDQNNNTDKRLKPKSKIDEAKDKLSLLQKMPLPYKVAKSLDPHIYRNTSFDAWLATKKEIEQTANLNAISILQPGDKCMVKLVNNYTEKWTVAYVQNMLQDSANVFVPELNESHCIPLENLKAYNNANDLLLIHYTGTITATQYQANNNNNNSNNGGQLQNYHGPNASTHGVQNVQKFVQSINSQFAKIFISSENKRKNTKKKSFSMKKSSSFHAFSTDLPTLIEVEEQNDDLFLYASSHHYYQTNANHPTHHNAHPHPNHHVHGNHNYQQLHHNHQQHHHVNNGSLMSNSSPYYSMPYSQGGQKTTNGPVKSANTSLLTTSSSANSLSTITSSSSSQHANANSANKNRRTKYNQFVSQPNTSGNKPPNWTNNFLPPNNNNPTATVGGPTGQSTNPASMAGHAHFMPPHQHAPAQPAPLHPTTLGPLVGQPFMPPPPAAPGALHHPHQPPPPAAPFLHHPNPSQPPPQPPHHTIPGQQRQNFLNPISSPFMFPPPPPANPLGHLNHLPHHQQMADVQQNFYFNSNAAGKGNLNPLLDQQQRKRAGETVDNFLNNNQKSTVPNQGYQQVPQHQHIVQPATGNLLASNGSSTTATDLTSKGPNQPSTAPAQNTSNYLLMPVPTTNQTQQQQTGQTGTSSLIQPAQQNILSTPKSSYGNGMSTSGMTRSHSYHAGISGYDQNNMYVDIYNQPGAHAMAPPNANTGAPNGTLLAGSNPSNNNASNSFSLPNNPNNLVGVDGTGINYGNGISGYEMHYSRFDGNLANGFVDETSNNLLNPTIDNRQVNMWKTNKLTRSTSLFTDMMYGGGPENNPVPMGNPVNNQQFCYTNCYVVNIDGPINFNATHSLQDDGSDLPFNDINTIRFFYNLGIEYYRLNIATPYNQTSNYQAPYTTSATTNQTQSGLVNYLSQSSASSTGTNGVLIGPAPTMTNNSTSNNSSNNEQTHIIDSTVIATTGQQQVVPSSSGVKPSSQAAPTQKSYNSSRRPN